MNFEKIPVQPRAPPCLLRIPSPFAEFIPFHEFFSSKRVPFLFDVGYRIKNTRSSVIKLITIKKPVAVSCLPLPRVLRKRNVFIVVVLFTQTLLSLLIPFFTRERRIDSFVTKIPGKIIYKIGDSIDFRIRDTEI